MLFQFVENGNGLTATIIPVGGTISVNTKKLKGILRFLYIAPATSTTEYDFQILDVNGRIVLQKTDEIGTIRSQENLPLEGKYTFKILNSNINEAFKILAVIQESK